MESEYMHAFKHKVDNYHTHLCKTTLIISCISILHSLQSDGILARGYLRVCASSRVVRNYHNTLWCAANLNVVF